MYIDVCMYMYASIHICLYTYTHIHMMQHIHQILLSLSLLRTLTHTHKHTLHLYTCVQIHTLSHTTFEGQVMACKCLNMLSHTHTQQEHEPMGPVYTISAVYVSNLHAM